MRLGVGSREAVLDLTQHGVPGFSIEWTVEEENVLWFLCCLGIYFPVAFFPWHFLAKTPRQTNVRTRDKAASASLGIFAEV